MENESIVDSENETGKMDPLDVQTPRKETNARPTHGNGEIDIPTKTILSHTDGMAEGSRKETEL